MKHYISHRGNLFGPIKQNENKPEYINNALEKGFEVEIDVFIWKSKLWLGHDNPLYEIAVKFLRNPKLWCHAKNLEALNYLLEYKDINVFWHQEDDFTLTSKGYIWTYPNKDITSKSILVVQEDISKNEIPNCLGICSDYIGNLV